jgi:hypothetical protein
MAEEDFQERAEPANRERERARLASASSAVSSEAGAPTSAVAPVQPWWPGSCLRCGCTIEGLSVSCDECEPVGQAAPKPPWSGPLTPQTLHIECEETFEFIAGVFRKQDRRVVLRRTGSARAPAQGHPQRGPADGCDQQGIDERPRAARTD